MATLTTDGPKVEAKRTEVMSETQYETWTQWPVTWSAVWVGTLAAIAAVLIFSLIGVAVGLSFIGPESRIVELKKVTLGVLAFSVFTAFLSFVIGGWIAGKVAGILHAEPAMLHGAIVWLVSVPLLVVLMGLGAGSAFGGWYAGLAGNSFGARSDAAPYERPVAPGPNATETEKQEFNAEMAKYRENVHQWQKDSPNVARNSALVAVTALLLGLVGSVIGGWMASGEPMTLTYTRQVRSSSPRMQV